MSRAVDKVVISYERWNEVFGPGTMGGLLLKLGIRAGAKPGRVHVETSPQVDALLNAGIVLIKDAKGTIHGQPRHKRYRRGARIKLK
jgi:hypothetical protein